MLVVFIVNPDHDVEVAKWASYASVTLQGWPHPCNSWIINYSSNGVNDSTIIMICNSYLNTAIRSDIIRIWHNNYSTNNVFYKWTEQSEKHGLHVGHNWILNKNWIELFYVKNCLHPKYNLNYLIAITLWTEVDYLH